MTSPLLDLPGAVAGDGVDAPVAAHYGSFNRRAARPRERRRLRRPLPPRRRARRGPGPADLAALADHPAPRVARARASPCPGWSSTRRATSSTRSSAADDGTAFTLHTEPGRAAALVEFLERMKFMMRAELTDVTSSYAVTWRPARGEGYERYELVPARPARGVRRGRRPGRRHCGRSRRCGSRAASRGSASTPTRAPSPTRSAGSARAVHMDKGCYRGQETVARVHTLGRPPRRLTLLHLDGSENRLPAAGADLLLGEKIGRLRRLLGPAPRARPDRAGAGQAERRPRRRAARRRHAGRPGGRGRPRGRAARAPAALSGSFRRVTQVPGQCRLARRGLSRASAARAAAPRRTAPGRPSARRSRTAPSPCAGTAPSSAGRRAAPTISTLVLGVVRSKRRWLSPSSTCSTPCSSQTWPAAPRAGPR